MGFTVKRVLMSDRKTGFNVIGFIDDDRSLQGKMINGIPVYGYDSISREFIIKHRINSLVIAINKISTEKKAGIIRSAIDLGLEVLDTPTVDKWLNGELQSRQISV